MAVRLEPRLDKSLLAYATAAAAAGVGVLALANPAEAKIVYTPANKHIAPNGTLPLDLNHDGKVDFTFVDTHGTSTFGGGWGFLTMFPNRSLNKIWGHTSNGFERYASALAAGVSVGSKGQFAPGERIMAWSAVNQGARKHGVRKPSSTYCYGPWKHATNLYLGLQFIIKGKTHYGWARLNVGCSNLIVTATLTGYAYETIPNKPIITGKTKGPDVVTLEPATLGRLAQGASGVSAWRENK
jgi:hypothetical protein